MPQTVSELQVVVSADTSKAEAGLSSFNSKLGSIGAGLATAFGALAVGGIAAVGGALVASTASAAGFEKQMSAIKAVSGATAGEMEQLSSLALQLGADTSFSASEAAKGIEELIKAGVSVGDVMGGGAAAALNLAAAGGLSVAESAEIASNAMNVFSLKGADVGHVADVIAGAANASAIDVHDFGMSLSAAGAVAATVGIGFDDLGTAIAVMGQAGIKGSDAGTSLKTMLLNLTPATDKQLAVARELGIVTADGANRFFDASGKAKSLAEIAGVLQEATAGLTEQQKLQALQTLFGTDAIRAAAIMAKAGSEGFNEMAASIGKVTAEAVAQERLNNLAGTWEQLTGSLETAGITIGQHLLPPLTELLKWGTEALNGLIPTLEELGKKIGSAMSDGIVRAKDLFRQLGDAWTTMKQAFSGDWKPDASIEPLAQAAGNAALKVKELSDWAGRVRDAMRDNGALTTFAQTLETIGREAGVVTEQLRQLSQTSVASGDLASGLAILARGFDLTVLAIAEAVDGTLVFVHLGLDLLSFLGQLGRAVTALATGDMESFNTAMQNAAKAGEDFESTSQQFMDRTVERIKQGFADITGTSQTEMGATAAAVETNMSAANDAVGTNSAGMQRFMEENGAGMTTAAQTAGQGVATATETGMAQAVGAVQTQGPQAVAAAESMGTGMSGAIEAAGPAMASAAGSGASSAVAAVQAQTGPASSAGSAVGSSAAQGIASGVQAGEGGILAAIKGVISRMWAAAWGPEGIDARSPSKKGVALAENVNESISETLSKADLSDVIVSQIKDMIDAAQDYIPTATQIARVESEIKEIRDRAQADALWRGKDMIDIESESLRLKQAQVKLERDLLPLRQDLARATREITDIERGSLTDRSQLIEMDGKRKLLRLQEIELEKQLIGLERDSPRAKAIQDQIDRLHDQDRLLSLEADRIETTNSLAATAARVRREGLDDQVRGQQAVIDRIKDQIDVLGSEQSVFQANENIIKNATQNEIDYRNRLIDVFRSEAQPLTARINAGLQLIDQLEAEGAISKELADKLRGIAKEANASTASTQALASAAGAASPQIEAATRKAQEMARQAEAIARASHEAASQVSQLASQLNRLPSWFTPKGSSSIFGGGRADGGPVKAGVSYLVGERGMPELFTPGISGTVTPILPPPPPSSPDSGGTTQTLRLDIAIGGRVAKRVVIEGYDIAVREGWTPGGLTG